MTSVWSSNTTESAIRIACKYIYKYGCYKLKYLLILSGKNKVGHIANKIGYSVKYILFARKQRWDDSDPPAIRNYAISN